MKITTVLERLEDIILRRDFEFTELQGAGLTLIYGVWLLIPFTYVVTPQFALLLVYAPPWAWSSIFLSVGFTGTIGLIFSAKKVRRIATFLTMMLWLFVSVLTGLSDWRLPAFPMCVAFMLGAFWGFIRLRRLSND